MRHLPLLSRLGLIGSLALAGVTAASAQTATFDDKQRAAIEQIVRDYIVKHPEVIQEAAAELERKQAEEQRQVQQSALRVERETILNSRHSFVAGNPSGDVSLVEFFDYNCGYCKRALSDLRAMTGSDAKLRVVLKDFPVLGPDSVEAAKVALAVKAQLSGDKLFDYHVKLMETRGRVNGERAIAVARDLGADPARLKRDMESAEVKTAIQENMELGEKLGLTGTPAFVIGDEVVFGAVGLDPLKKAVANVRQCGRAAAC